jgi:hypothetical protein
MRDYYSTEGAGIHPLAALRMMAMLSAQLEHRIGSQVMISYLRDKARALDKKRK